MTPEINEIDVRDKIVEHLKEEKRSMRWLSEESGIKYSYLYSCLKQRLFRMSNENLKTINKLLRTKFRQPRKKRAKNIYTINRK